MTLKNFAGSVVVITGGASGIGLATAQECYKAEAHVVLADKSVSGLQQAGQLVRESNPTSAGEVLAVPTDVTQEEQLQELMRQAMGIAGHIDLVVTCAGLGKGGLIDDVSGAEMQTLMNVNFLGTYQTVRAALPAMRQQHSGHFVLLSSVAGKLCSPFLTAYTATKWAVRGFSAALRAELYGIGIGVTTVYPAWVDTPMLHQEEGEVAFSQIEILLTPQQVAEEIVRAVQEDRRDLTLAPNADIALLLQIMQANQDKAEDVAGQAFQQQVQQAQNAAAQQP